MNPKTSLLEVLFYELVGSSSSRETVESSISNEVVGCSSSNNKDWDGDDEYDFSRVLDEMARDR